MQRDQYDRQAAYRRRKRMGRVLVVVEVGPAERRALESLELLKAGAPTKAALREAVQRFLACAPAIADIPRRIYPE